MRTVCRQSVLVVRAFLSLICYVVVGGFRCHLVFLAGLASTPIALGKGGGEGYGGLRSCGSGKPCEVTSWLGWMGCWCREDGLYIEVSGGGRAYENGMGR